MATKTRMTPARRAVASKRAPGKSGYTWPKLGPKHPERVPLETVLAYIWRAQGEIAVDGAVTWTDDVAPASWLPALCAAHVEALGALAKRRAARDLIEPRIHRLQTTTDPELIRRGAPWLRARIEEFASVCDLPEGYTDPQDPFAWECLTVWRRQLETVEDK